MNEIYRKEPPKCCAECEFFNAGQSIEHMWCRLGINYLHISVNISRDNRCPLRDLAAHDKQVRAKTAREIIGKIRDMGFCAAYKIQHDTDEKLADYILDSCERQLNNYCDELSEKYKEGE